jgi:iron(III) transport system ATP-binding protein
MSCGTLKLQKKLGDKMTRKLIDISIYLDNETISDPPSFKPKIEYFTHDQTEAFTIADKVGVVCRGELLQWDTPYQIYHHPTNQFVAEFIGQSFFLKGIVLASGRIKTELGEVPFNSTYQTEIGQTLEVLIRAENVQLEVNGAIRATIINKAFRGAMYLYTLKLDSGTNIVAFNSSHHCHEVGEKIGVCLDNKKTHHVMKNPQS